MDLPESTSSSKQRERLDQIDKNLNLIEARLLEQEHRPYSLIKNYVNRHKWKKGDKRRKAVIVALFWRLLFSPATVAAAGGALALMTVILLNYQNLLLEKQNEKIEHQTHLLEASRRSSQVFIMGEVLSDVNLELKDPHNFNDSLSPALTSRIVSLSLAMRPYRYWENEGLTAKSLSPERAQLIIALIGSGLNEDFWVDHILSKAEWRHADLSHTDLIGRNLSTIDLENARLLGASLEGANVRKSNLMGADFTLAYLIGTNFELANMKEAIFTKADLTRANLAHTDLSNTSFFNANLERANLYGAFLFNTDFRGVNSLNGAIVDGYDWFDYVKKRFEPIGMSELERDYKVDSIFYPELNQTLPTLVLKKDSVH